MRNGICLRYGREGSFSLGCFPQFLRDPTLGTVYAPEERVYFSPGVNTVFVNTQKMFYIFFTIDVLMAERATESRGKSLPRGNTLDDFFCERC